MAKDPPIFKLPDELLDQVLDELVHDPERCITIDHRASLSVESFQPAPPPSPEDSKGIGNFKLVCRRWAKLGLSRQFSRVAIRFEKAGFDRLIWVAKQPHLAREVKKFSYIIPIFYRQGRERFLELLEHTRELIVETDKQIQQRRQINGTQHGVRIKPDINQLRKKHGQCKKDEAQILETMKRAESQKEMIDNETDAKTLLFALKAFRSLQQIRLMRIQDQTDAGWANYLARHQDLTADFRPIEWTMACEHATKTLGMAFLKSDSPATRFSSRFMDTRSPLQLTHGSQATIRSLAERLTCVELQFNDPSDLDEKMYQLSSLFDTLFSAATNLLGVHIGFPRGKAVSVPLETVFHHVQWNKIRYIGIGAWRLNSDEIIDLVRRHKGSLRSLRLRDVLLKDGSKWSDILKILRFELTLKWVSLRRAGYARFFDAPQTPFGGHFIPVLQGPESDTDEASDWEEEEDTQQIFDESAEHPEVLEDLIEQEEEDDDDDDDDDDHDHDDNDDEDDFMSTGASSAPDDDSDVDDGPVNHDNSIDDEAMVHHSTPADDEELMPHQTSSASYLNNSIATINTTFPGATTTNAATVSSASALASCSCNVDFSEEEDMDDTNGNGNGGGRGRGNDVSKVQWKLWEQWVINKCSIHGKLGRAGAAG
ncbi:hypothetical protein F5884DRAFT_225636 [Xylogone sp. PMI_703]|nr:hypothetical protein F5884DRAFT_225636 [Xylogone sp. PMI_703]